MEMRTRTGHWMGNSLIDDDTLDLADVASQRFKVQGVRCFGR